GGYKVPLNYKKYTGSQLKSHPLRPYFGSDLIALISFEELIFDWPERWCVDYALAAKKYGAYVANYTELVSATYKDDSWLLELSDHRTSCQYYMNSKALINLTGVWSDKVNGLCREEEQQPCLNTNTVRANKGCHFLIKLPQDFIDVGIISRNSLGHLFL